MSEKDLWQKWIDVQGDIVRQRARRQKRHDLYLFLFVLASVAFCAYLTVS